MVDPSFRSLSPAKINLTHPEISHPYKATFSPGRSKSYPTPRPPITHQRPTRTSMSSAMQTRVNSLLARVVAHIVFQEGIVVDVSYSALAILGYNEARQLIGKTRFELLKPVQQKTLNDKTSPEVRLQGATREILCQIEAQNDSSGLEVVTFKESSPGRDTVSFAHEIRNATVVIEDMATRLEPTKDQQQFIQSIVSTCNQISGVTEGFLRGYQDENVFSLKNLLDNLTTQRLVKSQEKRILFTTEIEPTLSSHSFQGNAIAIQQILLNYTSNAFKFTPEGGKIHIRVSPTESSLIRFEVSDTGNGIELESQKKLFKRRSQPTIDITAKEISTGVGLAICKELAESLGGQVGVVSERGAGSTFWCELPLKPIAIENAIHPSPIAAKPLPLLSILIVDDNEIARLVLARKLSQMGQIVHQVSNGKEAIETLQKIENIHLIFMDDQMPLLDGVETTRQIRQFSQTPIIAFSGFSDLVSMRRFAGVGMNGYCPKNCPLERLKEIVYHTAEKSSSESPWSLFEGVPESC